VTYTDSTGRTYTVDATVGESVMAAAVKNGDPGIVAECGGNCSCATCHVWVRAEYAPLVGTPGDMEDDLLDMGSRAAGERAASPARSGSPRNSTS
jgi:2Fe-2S ferredoxin